jgi:hypothetical protein
LYSLVRGETDAHLQVVRLAAVASSFLPLSILAQEKKIKRSDLPPAVEETVAAQSLGRDDSRLFRRKGERADFLRG